MTKIIEKRKGRRLKQATRDLVIKLYNEDELTCKEIANACNISERTLYTIVAEARKEQEGDTNEA